MDGSAKAYGSGSGWRFGCEVPSVIISIHLKTAGPQEGLHSCAQTAMALLSAPRMVGVQESPIPRQVSCPQEGRKPTLVEHAGCMLSVHPYSQSRDKGLKTMQSVPCSRSPDRKHLKHCYSEN